MKNLLYILTTAILVLASCSKEDAETIVGTWELQYTWAHDKNLPVNFETENECEITERKGQLIVAFSKDGVLTENSVYSNNCSVNYSLDKDRIVVSGIMGGSVYISEFGASNYFSFILISYGNQCYWDLNDRLIIHYLFKDNNTLVASSHFDNECAPEIRYGCFKRK